MRGIGGGKMGGARRSSRFFFTEGNEENGAGRQVGFTGGSGENRAVRQGFDSRKDAKTRRGKDAKGLTQWEGILVTECTEADTEITGG